MGVKQDVLSRYERDAQNRVIIDVAAERTEDLYNFFDKHAPYMRRDLDQELADYLVDCVSELPPRENFVICFTFAEPADEEKRSRVRSSVSSFFLYAAERERNEIGQMLRTALLFFAVGIVIMSVAVWVRQWLGESRSVVGDVFAEGLTVAAWVSLWESVAILLIGWRPRLRNVRHYRRLASAELSFRDAESK